MSCPTEIITSPFSSNEKALIRGIRTSAEAMCTNVLKSYFSKLMEKYLDDDHEDESRVVLIAKSGRPARVGAFVFLRRPEREDFDVVDDSVLSSSYLLDLVCAGGCRGKDILAETMQWLGARGYRHLLLEALRTNWKYYILKTGARSIDVPEDLHRDMLRDPTKLDKALKIMEKAQAARLRKLGYKKGTETWDTHFVFPMMIDVETGSHASAY